MKNKFILEAINEALFHSVLKIYNTNQEYFMMSMNDKPSITSVIEDMNAIPPGSSFENKKYCLIKSDGLDIGVIDCILHYPDENILYIGLFMIDGSFQRSGYGRAFIGEFIQTIRSEGFEKVRLGVLDQNETGLKFWTNMGFKVEKEVINRIHSERNWKIKVMEMRI